MIELRNNELTFVNGGASLVEQFGHLNEVDFTNHMDYQSAYQFANNLKQQNPVLFALLGHALTLKQEPKTNPKTTENIKTFAARHANIPMFVGVVEAAKFAR